MAAKIICLVSNDLKTDQRMIRVCTSLARTYEVELVGVSPKPDNEFDNFLKPSKEFKELMGDWYDKRKLRVFFTSGKLFYLELQIRFFFFLLFAEFDMIYAVDLDTLLPARIVARLKSKKLIYDAHEYFVEVPELVGRKLEQGIWNQIAKSCIPKADLAITVSESLTKVLQERYKKPFVLVRNVPLRRVRETNLTPKEPKVTYDLIYQGALNVGRRLELLLESMQYNSYSLAICGTGDVEEELKSQVQRLGLQDRVHFLGPLYRKSLLEVTENSRLGFNLLENKGLSYYYSLANKFFDYVQAGIPQICADFPEYAKLNAVYEVAVLTNVTSAKALAELIERTLANKDMYLKLKSNALIASNAWTWEKEEESLLNAIKDLD